MSKTSTRQSDRSMNVVLRWLLTFLARYWGVILVLLSWQAWVSYHDLNTIVLPQPLNVLYYIIDHPMVYFENTARTMTLALLGLLIGMAVGTIMAVLAWTSRLLSGMLVPLGLIFSSVPIVALIPILARILGYDVKTVLAIVVVISFFPAFVFTSAGLRALPDGSNDLFTVMGASSWRRFFHLVAPSAVPSWMIAFRLAAPPAILAAMVAEFLMGSSGLGYIFRTALMNFEMECALGTSIIAASISVLVFSLTTIAENKVNERWT